MRTKFDKAISELRNYITEHANHEQSKRMNEYLDQIVKHYRKLEDKAWAEAENLGH